MFPILRQPWTLWAAWIVGSGIVLFANPWFPFGWAELMAVLGSLLLAIDRRSRRERVLAVGLPLIALLAVIDPGGNALVRMVADWFVFVGGVLFGARAVDDQFELEAIAGHLALGPDAERAHANFLTSVKREIGRCRRHERSFVVLSIVPVPHLVSEKAEVSRVQGRIAEARWMLEIRSLVEAELHLYCDVVATEERMLCIVPEVDEASIDGLNKRLSSVIEEALGIAVLIGYAFFPRDALGVEDLIAAADASRRLPRLESVPSRASKDAGEAVAPSVRDVRT